VLSYSAIWSRTPPPDIVDPHVDQIEFTPVGLRQLAARWHPVADRLHHFDNHPGTLDQTSRINSQ